MTAINGARAHQPGRLMFCNWSCHDGYLADVRYALAAPRRIVEANREAGDRDCVYCGADVPTNRDRADAR